MKKYIALLGLLFLAGTAMAQRPAPPHYDREQLQAARIAFITTRLDLKPEQAEKFWPIFNEYSEIKESTMREIGRLSDSETDLSEDEAKSRINKRFQLQQKLIDEERKFVDNISKVITYNQTLKLNNIARDFTRQIYQRGRGGK
ncbi:hypothetical protein D0X99_18000 [Algoriphagus lacus]|uniref:Sensor of ECF-type sigma factor n=1 Tax=Algoriphagus lacus TaxID=2056311 RepID=A0A418PN03_9BACT|nr:hypothetical protein [Algoriphagus lacus]RIW12786.1 hypothetical protein D0X99_18000 [Algoriphagus lacus]